MTPRDRMVDVLLTVSHVPGRGALTGADCWGIVEVWYQTLLGITLDDRAAHRPGPSGLQAGFNAARHWKPAGGWADDCLVIMRARRLTAGHVGVCYRGHVLHSNEHQGCVFEALDSPRVAHRITGFLKYLS